MYCSFICRCLCSFVFDTNSSWCKILIPCARTVLMIFFFLIINIICRLFAKRHKRKRRLCESPHQAVAVEGGVDAAKEEPAGPQVLQSELQDEVGQQHQRPHHHKLQDGVRAARRQRDERDVCCQRPRLPASHKTRNDSVVFGAAAAAASALKPCRYQNRLFHPERQTRTRTRARALC